MRIRVPQGVARPVLRFRLVKHARACVLLEHMGKPRDDKQAAQDLARDLADIAEQLASLKGEASSSLRDPNYDTLKLRLESAHSALEAAALWRPGEGYG